MLPELELDNENFDDIIDEARNMIISLYPEWTDFNYHDPGITILELFSWLKESQQFFLDQIGEEGKLKYLKLLGIQMQHKQAAEALVHVKSAEDFRVLRGTRLYAGKVCFEVVETSYISKGTIETCLLERGGEVDMLDRSQLEFGHKLKVFLFGKEPQQGNAFYIGFSEGLPANTRLSLLAEIFSDYPVKRSPVGEGIYPPLARLKLEYSTRHGFQEVAWFDDETNGMVTTGQIHFSFEEEMEPIAVNGLTSCYVRIILAENNLDIPPILEGISMNLLSVRQRDTIIESANVRVSYQEEIEGYSFLLNSQLAFQGRNDIYVEKEGVYYLIPSFEKYYAWEQGGIKFCIHTSDREISQIKVVNYQSDDTGKTVLGTGNGFPSQVFDLNDLDLEYESFALMVHEIGTEDGFCMWEKVSDFADSSPEDKHYVLDSRNGMLHFGNCIHGMAPEGKIILVTCVRTLGMDGNVKANKINQLAGLKKENILVWNQTDSHGGRNEETLEESFFRARRLLKQPQTAVTYEDYEAYVKQTPGLMIESCKVIPSQQMNSNTIHIVVKPFSYKERKSLSEHYKRNILRHVETCRLLGTKIKLLSPQYVKLELYMDIVIKPHYPDARERINQAVWNYFEKLKVQFGALIVYSELYGVIDMLDCVSKINAITLDEKSGDVIRSQDGNMTLPPNGVAEVENIQYLLTVEE